MLQANDDPRQLALERTYVRTEEERSEIETFVARKFGNLVVGHPLPVEEQAAVEALLDHVEAHFEPVGRYHLGLAIDFVVLAELVDGGESSDFEPTLTEKDLYERRETFRKKKSDTLTLKGADGQWHGVRGVEEALYAAYQRSLRTDYPSAAPHNSKAWRNYRELLVQAFSLSREGRSVALDILLDYGLARMARSEAFAAIARTRLFPIVVDEYPRDGVKGENGGVVFQGIVYGYLKADRSHLSIQARGSKTGGARAGLIGDVEGYYGASLELTVEVKDLALTEGNYAKQLGAFVAKVTQRGVKGIVVARSLSDEVSEALELANVLSLSQADLVDQLDFWDYAKQDVALNGLLHYLSHVEKGVAATARLVAFIRDRDPNHPCLAHFATPE